MLISDAVVLGCVAAIPPTLVALGGLWKSILNGQQSDQIKKSIDDRATIIDASLAAGDVKAEALKVKAQEIHESTNGNLSKVTEELKAANERIASLEKMVSALVEKVGK